MATPSENARWPVPRSVGARAESRPLASVSSPTTPLSAPLVLPPVVTGPSCAFAPERRGARDAFNAWLKAAQVTVYSDCRADARRLIDACRQPTGGFPAATGEAIFCYPGFARILRAATIDGGPLDPLSVRTGLAPAVIQGLGDPAVLAARQFMPAWREYADALAAACVAHMWPDHASLFGGVPREHPDWCVGEIARMLYDTQARSLVRVLQERRQQRRFLMDLQAAGYTEWATGPKADARAMPPGTYTMGGRKVYLTSVLDGTVVRDQFKPDVLVKPFGWPPAALPQFWELKSAGDETNCIKRINETTSKFDILKKHLGAAAQQVVFFGGLISQARLDVAVRDGLQFCWEHLPGAVSAMLAASATPAAATGDSLVSCLVEGLERAHEEPPEYAHYLNLIEHQLGLASSPSSLARARALPQPAQLVLWDAETFREA